MANLSKPKKDAFWVVLDNRSWMHPFDDQGRRRDYADIPKTVTDLVDDPFRSLAGELRLAGGYTLSITHKYLNQRSEWRRKNIERDELVMILYRASERLNRGAPWARGTKNLMLLL